MADELARLKMVVDSTQVTQATKALGSMTAEAKKAEAAQAAFAARTEATKRQMEALARGGGGAAAALVSVASTASTAGRSMDSALTGAASNAINAFMKMSGASMAARGALTGTFSAVMSSAGDFAAAFLPGGLVTGAVVFGLHKVIDYFTTARDEMKKTQAEFTKRLEEMRQAADVEGITRQAFAVNQTLTEKRALLARANDPNFGGLTVLQGLNARRTLPSEIQRLEAQMAAFMAAAQNPAAQYSPSSGVFPIRVTAGGTTRTGGGGRVRTGNPVADAIAAAQDEAAGIAEFQMQRAARAAARADAKIGGGGFDSLGPASDSTKSALGGLANLVKGGDMASRMRTQASQAQALYQSFADGMQRTFANAFTGLFTKGLSSATAFAAGIRDLLINAFSEVLASRAVAALFGGGGVGGGSMGGGLLGALGMGGAALGGGKFANAAKGGGSFNIGAGAMVGLGGLGLGSAIGQQFGTGAGVLGGAATGAALGTIVPGIGNVAGAIIGGLAGAIGGLFGGTARKKAREAEARAIAEAKSTYGDDGVSAGTYLAPAGFSAASYRFTAGRPSTVAITGPVTITVPPGTSAEQAQAMLAAFEALARAQGLSTGTLPRAR